MFVGPQYGTRFTFSAGIPIKLLCGLLCKHVEMLVNTRQVSFLEQDVQLQV